MKQVFHTCLLLIGLVLSASLIRPEQEKLRKIKITTDKGDMIAVLYNETPRHRDNFIKNISNKLYYNLLWHRVINEFMIQGGDPDSKNAAPGAVLGNGSLGYTIAPEFLPQYFHKRGALAAARMGDDVNPKKESSACQFYIVHGKTFDEALLHKYEERINNNTCNQIFNNMLMKPENKSLLDSIKTSMANRDNSVAQRIYQQLFPEIEKELNEKGKFAFSKEQIEAYTTIGGAPHLDGSYTVFGEVIEGFDVLDKIATLPVDANNRPNTDVKFTITLIEE